MKKAIEEKYCLGFQKMLEDKEAVYELLKALDGKYPRVCRELTWAYNHIQDAYAIAYREMFDKKYRWKKKTRKTYHKYRFTRKNEEQLAELYRRESQGEIKGN